MKPRTNFSLSLKDHRFNHLQDCCLSLVYHKDDISDYLPKFSNIVNGITVLDSFVQMEVLKPMFSAIPLVGIHITGPFYGLLITPDTNYSTLLSALRKLYDMTWL